MQTTVPLDDEVAAQARKLAGEMGCDLPNFIEAAVREKIARTPENLRSSPPAFIALSTFGSGGVCAGVNIDDSAALFELMEQRA